MKKFLAAFILLLGVNVWGSVAKGQHFYVQICKSCHGTGAVMAPKFSAAEWERYFDEENRLLVSRHAAVPDAAAKFGEANFARKAVYVRDFVTEFSKDSGVLPDCGNSSACR